MELPNITPCGGKVLVRQIVPAEKTEGGILLPDVVQQNKKKDQGGRLLGVVEKVGPGKYDPVSKEVIPIQLKPGQGVVVVRYSITDVSVDEDEGIFLVEEEDVWGMFEPHIAKPEDEEQKLVIPPKGTVVA